MKLTQGKRNEILQTLVNEAYSKETENKFLADLSEELKKLKIFEIPIMLYNNYPKYVRPENGCYISGNYLDKYEDKYFELTFTYANAGYLPMTIQLNNLPSEVIEIVNNIAIFRKGKSDFRANLRRVLDSCNTSTQLINLIPDTSRFFNELPKNTQVIPKELIDKVNSVIKIHSKE